MEGILQYALTHYAINSLQKPLFLYFTLFSAEWIGLRNDTISDKQQELLGYAPL